MKLTLAEALRNLSYGELSNLAMAEAGAGTIREADIPRVVRALNDTMHLITNRFSVSEGVLIVVPDKDKAVYPLVEEFTYSKHVSDPIAYPEWFIQDSPDNPYDAEIEQVLAVKTDSGEWLPVNNLSDPESVMIAGENTLVLPEGLEVKYLLVVYRAKPDELEYDLDDYDQAIRLPSVFYPALYAGAAARLFSSMAGQEHMAKGAELDAKFENILNNIALNNPPEVFTTSGVHKFTQRGFV